MSVLKKEKITDMSKSLRAALVFAMMAVVIAVGVMIWAGQRLTNLSGVTHLALDAQEHIWLTLNGRLLRLNASGAIEKDFDPKALGLGDKAVVIVPMPNGHIWLGSQATGKFSLFTGEGARLAEAKPATAAGSVFGTFHAAYEAQSDRLIISDTQNHRLLAFSGAGDFIAASGSKTNLRFPNDIVAASLGTLLLADTNHHALVSVPPDLAQAPHVIVQGAAESQYEWPVFVAVAPGGQSYASWHDQLLLKGDVLAYTADGHYLHTLPLMTHAEPQSLLARSNDVLVAMKSDNDYSLYHFDHDGRDLGLFGDAHVQALLAEASAQQKHLRRLRAIARRGLLLGAIALLLAALSLRQRKDIAVADAIGAPRHSMAPATRAKMIFLLIGVVLVLLLVQLIGLFLGVGTVIAARHSGSHGLLLLAHFGVPLLMAVIIFGIALAWRSSKSFLNMHMLVARRRMQAWSPYIANLLRRGELVEDYGFTTSMWRSYVLIVTNRRLLLLPSTAGSSRKALWESGLQQVSAPQLLQRRWWLYLLNPVSQPVVIETSAGSGPLKVYCVNRWHARQLLEMVQTALTRSFERTQPQDNAADHHSPAMMSNTMPPALRSAALALLFPGLGHLDQSRTRQGLGLMLLALVVLSFSSLSWIVALRRFADQPPFQPLILAMMYLPVLLYGVWDVWRYAREATPAASRSEGN